MGISYTFVSVKPCYTGHSECTTRCTCVEWRGAGRTAIRKGFRKYVLSLSSYSSPSGYSGIIIVIDDLMPHSAVSAVEMVNLSRESVADASLDADGHREERRPSADQQQPDDAPASKQ